MKISKEFSFEASHILPRHPGKCSRLHGHSYKVTVGIEAAINSKTGFVLDYGVLKEVVAPLIARLDHRHLNEFIAYPSAENIAVNIGKQIHAELKARCTAADNQYRTIVAVQETSMTSAVWDSDDWSETESAEHKAGWMPPQSPRHVREAVEALEQFSK